MKSPLTELKEYAAKVDEMEFMGDPGDVINKLLALISKLPDELSSAEGMPSQEWFIHKGIEFSSKMKTDSVSYKTGAGFGYSCGLQDGYKLKNSSAEEAIDWEQVFENAQSMHLIEFVNYYKQSKK